MRLWAACLKSRCGTGKVRERVKDLRAQRRADDYEARLLHECIHLHETPLCGARYRSSAPVLPKAYHIPQWWLIACGGLLLADFESGATDMGATHPSATLRTWT